MASPASQRQVTLARSWNTQPISRGGRGAVMEVVIEKAGGKSKDREKMELLALRGGCSKACKFFFLDTHSACVQN